MRAKPSQIKRPAEVVTVGRRAYAAGLFWQPCRGKSARKDALAFAKQQGFEWVAMHVASSMLSAGMASHVAGGNRRSFSLAATLAAKLGPSWIAAFQVGPDRYVMAAARNGAIMPGSDRVGTCAEIQPAYEAYAVDAADDEHAWPRAIAPAEWKGANEVLSLDVLLAGVSPPRSAVLRPTTFRLTRRQLLIAASLAVSSVGSGVTAMKYQAAQAEAERQTRIEAAKAAMEAERVAEINRRIVAGPWKDSPPAAVVIETCADGMHMIPIEISAWLFAESKCTPEALVATYRRTGTATVGAFAAATEADFGKPVVLDNGETVAISYSSTLKPVDESELGPIQDQVMAFVSHLQRQATGLTLAEVRKGGVSEGVESPEQVAAWHAHDWKVEVGVPPDLLFRGLTLPGLRVASITTTLSEADAQLSWVIEGTIYGK